MRRIDPFILIIILIFVGILVGGVLVAYNMGGKPLQEYSQEDQEKPEAQLSGENIDLGDMSVSEIKTADFKIKNIGNKALQINNISTSCDCTFAQLEIGGKKSPRFSMHQNPAWMGEVNSGQEATVTVIYEPAKMPVKGKVERSVFMKTNDPKNPNISLTVTANVN